MREKLATHVKEIREKKIKIS